MAEDTLIPVELSLPAGGYSRSEAIETTQSSGLPEKLAAITAGPFGHSSTSLAVVEALVAGVDLGFAAANSLEGVISSELATEQHGEGTLKAPELAPMHIQALAAFQVVTTCDEAVRRLATYCPSPNVEGMLELDGLGELLETLDRKALATRTLRLLKAYLDVKAQSTRSDDIDGDVWAGTTIAAGLELLRRSVEFFANHGSLRPFLDGLRKRNVRINGFPYSGLKVESPQETPSGLLPLYPSDIVGNEEYLDAGLRLARDVAGFDFSRGRNPKRVNPVLFGLGRPGCGKTVTAHAIGNYFLDYCRQREVPARFLVVRRSDWASSYQNASAANLIRIFREEVYAFEGVCGVYWPDIDTALASRADSGLRMEEKQNLGAVFGVFDGTLLPKDGKWFLVCDANTMHMDEAAISRIAQNPFNVAGPTSPEHYAKLMRELMLKDVVDFIPSDEACWLRLGAKAVEHDLSGRAVDAVCGNIRAHIQDFEFPDEYFGASSSERDDILRSLSKTVDESFIASALDDWAKFKEDAQKRDEEDRFQAEVQNVVRQLNASRAAAEKVVGITDES